MNSPLLVYLTATPLGSYDTSISLYVTLGSIVVPTKTTANYAREGLGDAAIFFSLCASDAGKDLIVNLLTL